MRLPEPLRRKTMMVVVIKDDLFKGNHTYVLEKDAEGELIRADDVSEFLQKYHKKCLDKQIVVDALKKALCKCSAGKKCVTCRKLDLAAEKIGGNDGY